MEEEPGFQCSVLLQRGLRSQRRARVVVGEPPRGQPPRARDAGPGERGVSGRSEAGREAADAGEGAPGPRRPPHGPRFTEDQGRANDSRTEEESAPWRSEVMARRYRAARQSVPPGQHLDAH